MAPLKKLFQWAKEIVFCVRAMRAAERAEYNTDLAKHKTVSRNNAQPDLEYLTERWKYDIFRVK